MDDLKQTLSCVDGELYFSVGEAFFPCEDWREPVSVVLEQWIPGFLSFAQGHADACLLEFMDGPYCVKLNRDGSGGVHALFLRESKGVEMNADPAELIRSVRKVLRTYDRTMYQWGRAARWAKELSVFDHLLKQV